MRDETLNNLEEVINQNLERLATENISEQSRKGIVAETTALIQAMTEQEKSIYDYQDKAERIRLQEQRNEDEKFQAVRDAAIEEKKVGVSPSRFILEITKVVVPTLLSGGLFLILEQQIQKFEETGRYTSLSAKLLHGNTPKFMK